MKTIQIRRPDDWHVHFRDGLQLQDTVTATAKHCARALVMPNLAQPLTSVSLIHDYRQRILNHLSNQSHFTPYMTLYLNESISKEELTKAKQNPYILGGKLYPAGVTTNAQQGANSIVALYPIFEIMQNYELVLQIHGEVNHSDIFYREQIFIKQYLVDIIKNFPKLRIVLEHISTSAAVEFVLTAPTNVVATITPHHLLYNRNQLFNHGINPHYFCKPILKQHKDQKALQQAATSGNPKFFAGTDSAPHPQSLKESSCGCAGIYSAPYAFCLYAECFSTLDRLEQLNDFTSRFGAEFYHLPLNGAFIELIQKNQVIAERLPFGQDFVIPIAAGETIGWSIADE